MSEYKFSTKPYTIPKEDPQSPGFFRGKPVGSGVDFKLEGPDLLTEGITFVEDPSVINAGIRTGIESKDKRKGIFVDIPASGDATFVQRFAGTEPTDEDTLGTIPREFAEQVKAALLAGKDTLLTTPIDVKFTGKRGGRRGSRLHKQTRRAKRHTRNLKHRKLRKLTARRR